MLSAKFYEDFLDDISVDIDFDPKTKKLIAQTDETSYIESVELPTLTQLINQKSDEFIQAIITDLDTFVEFEVDNVTEYSDAVAYEVVPKFRTKVRAVYADLGDIYFNNSMLELDELTIKDFQKFLTDNKFSKIQAYEGSPTSRHILKINTTTQLDMFLNKLEAFSESHRTITNIKELDESIITKFKKFN